MSEFTEVTEFVQMSCMLMLPRTVCWTILTMSVTFLGQEVLTLWRSETAFRLNQKYFNLCFPKMSESLTGLEQCEGE